jgi:23S rRNA pseudouridine1911/1915/1917 synthase
VAGDPTYGGRARGGGPAEAAMRAFPRQALHAAGLTFHHPRTGEPLSFTSHLPRDIAELIGFLESFEKTIPD